MKRSSKTALRWSGIVLASALVALILAVSFMDWNLFKHPIESIASAKSGRTITIAGNLHAHVWSWTPTVTAEGLTIANPPWETQQRPMARIDRLEIHLKLLPLLAGRVILPRVALFRPDVYLHQDLQGRANWTFENEAPTNRPASAPTRLPLIRDLLIEDGRLDLTDEMRRLKVKGTLQAGEQKTKSDRTPLQIRGSGTINDQPFQLHVAGGPLVHLDPEHPYPFNLDITAGTLRVQSDGKVLKPFDLGGLAFEVTLSGKDLAEGFYLTQLALPNTPPFKLHAHIDRNGQRVAVTDIVGTVGESDVRGKLDIDTSRKRPYMSGQLLSDRLRMQDLAAPLGGHAPKAKALDTGPGTGASAAGDEAPPPTQAGTQHLFPDAQLQVNRVRAMDADVRFQAKSVDSGSIPFKHVSFRVKLDHGVLALDPLSLQMPQGNLTGSAKIDARTDIAKVHVDFRVKDIQLQQLKGKGARATAPMEGTMQARAVIDGKGNSVHSVASTANGTLTVILPDGEITSAFAELTGIDVAKGLGLLLTKANDKVPIRCGVAQFNVKDGTMNAGNITFDTQNVLIKGSGNINLGSEALDLEVKGEPKKFRLARLRTPIELRGHLTKPTFGVNVGSTAKQGAVAAALGTLLTPFAAVVAFVDPGLAKDQNCAAMIAAADSKAPKSPQPDFPSPNRSSSQSAAAPPASTDPKLR